MAGRGPEDTISTKEKHEHSNLEKQNNDPCSNIIGKEQLNHHGPESSAGSREAVREALTGGSAGQPLSSEITQSRVPTSLDGREGNTVWRR